MGVFILLYRKSVFHECRPMQRVTENAKVQQVHPFAVKKRKKVFLFLQSSKNIADGVEISSKIGIHLH